MVLRTLLILNRQKERGEVARKCIEQKEEEEIKSSQ